MKKEKNEGRKHSIFQIVSIVLVIVLSIAIIIQIGIMISLQNKIDDTNHKNDQLPEIEEPEQGETENEMSIEKVNNFKYKVVVKKI